MENYIGSIDLSPENLELINSNVKDEDIKVFILDSSEFNNDLNKFKKITDTIPPQNLEETCHEYYNRVRNIVTNKVTSSIKRFRKKLVKTLESNNYDYHSIKRETPEIHKFCRALDSYLKTKFTKVYYFDWKCKITEWSEEDEEAFYEGDDSDAVIPGNETYNDEQEDYKKNENIINDYIKTLTAKANIKKNVKTYDALTHSVFRIIPPDLLKEAVSYNYPASTEKLKKGYAVSEKIHKDLNKIVLNRKTSAINKIKSAYKKYKTRKNASLTKMRLVPNAPIEENSNTSYRRSRFIPERLSNTVSKLRNLIRRTRNKTPSPENKGGKSKTRKQKQ